MGSALPLRTPQAPRPSRVAAIRPNGHAIAVKTPRKTDARTTSFPARPPDLPDHPLEEGWSRLSELSPRERQIVRLVAEGHVNKTIGAVLDISQWTVATHLRRIFAKLGVASRASMIAALYGSGNREIE